MHYSPLHSAFERETKIKKPCLSMTEVLTVGKSSVARDLCLLIEAAKLKTPGYITFSCSSKKENIFFF